MKNYHPSALFTKSAVSEYPGGAGNLVRGCSTLKGIGEDAWEIGGK